MAGLFPNAVSGGVSPTLIPFSYNPVIAPVNTTALYYPDNCGVKLTPEVLNSLISEMICLTDAAGNAYNGASQCNISAAIKKLITAAVPILSFGTLTPVSQSIAAGTYGAVSGNFDVDTIITNADLVRYMDFVVLDSHCRVANNAGNTANISGQSSLSFGGAPFQQGAYSGAVSAGFDYNGAMRGIATLKTVIPPNTSLTITNRITWTVYQPGTIALGSTALESNVRYLTVLRPGP